ncbi:hypothetical protein AB0N33_00930 [Pseudarthrobacter oxydans]|uniref:hypothetical protein n=1 Tax=Pseudarthrobacter oxydans TaxID=1671 RepID=UPI00343AEBCB
MTDAQIWEPTEEPNWKQIGWKYEELAKACQKLSADVTRYKAALMELDGAGTDIGFGRERIAAIREHISQLEKEKS